MARQLNLSQRRKRKLTLVKNDKIIIVKVFFFNQSITRQLQKPWIDLSSCSEEDDIEIPRPSKIRSNGQTPHRNVPTCSPQSLRPQVQTPVRSPSANRAMDQPSMTRSAITTHSPRDRDPESESLSEEEEGDTEVDAEEEEADEVVADTEVDAEEEEEEAHQVPDTEEEQQLVEQEIISSSGNDLPD